MTELVTELVLLLVLLLVTVTVTVLVNEKEIDAGHHLDSVEPSTT